MISLLASSSFARRALLLLIFACCAMPSVASADEQPEAFRISYQLAMPRPASHLFEVKIEVETKGAIESVDFQMPRWSPGRYGVFDFAKNVQEFRAAAGICPAEAMCKTKPLSASRVDDQTWRVATDGNAQFTASYKVFADDLSGTFSQLDARHANFNPGTIFMYVVGHKPDPVRLRITTPAGWRITNGRQMSDDGREWEFPNYDILMDTPTEIAPDWTVDEFKVDGKTYRVVVHSFGDEAGKRPQFVRDVERIVRAETKMWGAPDFDSYTFLVHFAADDRSGDGMEHLTSTQIIESGTLAEESTYQSALDTVAHEFFHVWNMKRLRPIELGPWDFTRPVSTRGLWIGEGFTNYYGHLMLRRAGLRTEAEALAYFGAYIGNVENAPGSRITSAEELSLLAPTLDGTPHAQRTNLANTSIPGYYYAKGEVLALTLDLLIRTRTNGRRSLDDVMRGMYEDFYLNAPTATYYLRGRGYTNEEFARKTSEVASTDFSDFFARHVRGTEPPPYAEAFAGMGLRFTRAPAAPNPYTAGIELDFGSKDARIANVLPDSAAERAGLSRGDVITKVSKKSVTNATWRNALNRFKEGDRIPLTIKRDRRTLDFTVTLLAPERFDYRIEEDPAATTDAKRLRAAWLN